MLELGGVARLFAFEAYTVVYFAVVFFLKSCAELVAELLSVFVVDEESACCGRVESFGGDLRHHLALK